MIRIIRYTRRYRQAFLKLYRDYLQHYNIAAAIPEVEAKITGLLAQQRHMACHIAMSKTVPLGFATWGLAFPAGNQVSLVMKELFVSPDARGQGVGRALMAALMEQARSDGCVRMDWATDAENQVSQAFYRKISAPRHGKISYRVRAEEFDHFITILSK